jgi:GNAT superfamily N-acetyltransferase
MEKEEIEVLVANVEHEVYVDTILDTIAEAAKVRGTGIAKRTHEYLAKKMAEAKAVIALRKSDGRFAGFSYIETWENQQYVTTSGLIVHPDFRGLGLAKRIKDMTFTLARTRWPHAKIFSLTSGAAVMTMNTQLGYQPVTFADLTDDEAFWKGCEGCVNVDVLHRTGRKYCICTAMLYDPTEHLPAKISDEVMARIRHLEELEEK